MVKLVGCESQNAIHFSFLKLLVCDLKYYNYIEIYDMKNVKDEMEVGAVKYLSTYGGEVLNDRKKLGGIGRLNEKSINRLQNHYGLAIRQNTDSLINTRKAPPKHCTCSEWCKYRMAEKKGEVYERVPKPPYCLWTFTHMSLWIID